MPLTLIKRNRRHLREKYSMMSVFVEFLHDEAYLSGTCSSLPTLEQSFQNICSDIECNANFYLVFKYLLITFASRRLESLFVDPSLVPQVSKYQIGVRNSATSCTVGREHPEGKSEDSHLHTRCCENLKSQKTQLRFLWKP
jgi:hypothetical protein